MNRIGIVALSKPVLGGTFQYTLSMIDALRRVKKNSYIIFTTVDNDSYDGLGLPLQRLPSLVKTVFEFMRLRMSTGKHGGLFRDVDTVIAPIYSTRLLASRKPFLFTLHDLQERYYPTKFTYAQRGWRFFVNKSLSRAARGIICESTHVKRDIENFLNVDPAKISVIPAPPVPAFSTEHIEAASLRLQTLAVGLPEQYLFYPAQFFAHKNHRRLVEAFSQVLKTHPKCHLLFTGEQKYQYSKVMARVRELGIGERVRHLGYINNDTMAAVFLRATLVVVPTLFESISIPVYEAFRMGVPVCASNVVALPEQIGDAGVLFDPFNVEDIAHTISQLLDDPQWRAELVCRGSNRIAPLTMDRYAGQLENLLDREI